ncbi:hypothetical protein C8Q80DRAFT_1275743 [Daedaleopsis nitida]|nr:hypothetical protein C8Q80DRAFT_1275743 [Daedaleopsis nitida]
MSSEQLTLFEKAELLGIVVHSLLLGSFAVLFCIAGWLLLFRGRGRRLSSFNIAFFAVSTTLFVLSLAGSGLTVQRGLEGFVENGSTPHGPAVFYAQLSSPTSVAQNAIYVTTILIGDGFLTYRCYVVWNRDWRATVLPVLLLLGTAVSGYGACIELSRSAQDFALSTFLTSSIPTLIALLYSLPLVTNLVLTSLIVGRIAWTRLRSKRSAGHAQLTVLRGRSYWNIVETLVHTAAVTTLALAAVLVTYLAGSMVLFTLVNAIQPLIGLVCTLAVMLVHMRHHQEAETTGSPSEGLSGIRISLLTWSACWQCPKPESASPNGRHGVHNHKHNGGRARHSRAERGVRANLESADKQAYVNEFAAEGETVLFCSDGTSDAVALAQGTIGFRLHTDIYNDDGGGRGAYAFGPDEDPCVARAVDQDALGRRIATIVQPCVQSCWLLGHS